MPFRLHLTEKEIEFYKPLVALYLKYGSVDKVFAQYKQNTGVSYPHFHRILNEWGIIKSAGPQSHFAEAVYFLTALAKNKLPLETLYKTMPPSLQISAVTLHRILSYIKRGLVRRYATALIITPEENPNLILIGQDISTPRPEIGKPYGSFSLPMTYSKYDEPAHDSILRAIQQEVASTRTLERTLPGNLIPKNNQAILTIDIADVRVNVYHLTIPQALFPNLDSFKLNNLTFVPIETISQNIGLESNYRAGVPEIAFGFLETKNKNFNLPPHFDSQLNKHLTLLPAYQNEYPSIPQ